MLLLQGAMDIEISLLVNALEARREVVRGGYRFFLGSLGGRPAAVSKTQIGMANAAAATLHGLLAFSPALVINQGTAGGHNPDWRAGEIVVGGRMVSLGARRDGPVWERRSTEVFQNGRWEEAEALCPDPGLFAAAMRLPLGRRTGVIGTGDTWNDTPERIARLRQMFQTDCEDMETFAAAQVCRAMRVPFLGVRVLSNSLPAGDPYDPDTADVSQAFVLQLCRHL